MNDPTNHPDGCACDACRWTHDGVHDDDCGCPACCEHTEFDDMTDDELNDAVVAHRKTCSFGDGQDEENAAAGYAIYGKPLELMTREEKLVELTGREGPDPSEYEMWMLMEPEVKLIRGILGDLQVDLNDLRDLIASHGVDFERFEAIFAPRKEDAK